MSSVTKIIKVNKFTLLLLLVVSLVTLYIKFSLTPVVASVDNVGIENKTKTYKVSATQLIPVPVSGIVEATDSVIVRAKMAGEITGIMVREGRDVMTGDLLSIQDTPVENAQYNLAAAQVDLSAVQNASMISVRHTADIEQTISALTAREVALLRQSDNSGAVTESVKQLAITLDEAVTNLSATADFVEQHRSLFTASGMKKYREIVDALYNRQPNYLTNSVLFGEKSSGDIINKLQKYKDDGEYEATEIQAIAVLVETQLNALTELLATGENDIFDARVVSNSDPVYAEYLSSREMAIATASRLQNSMSKVRSTLSATSEDLLQQGKLVEITEADANEAKRQVEFAKGIEEASSRVARGGLAVVGAQLSLSTTRAPFSGSVGAVYADVGEYVQPGSPVMLLVGTKGRELVVTIPATFVAHLAEGQEFVRGDEVIGYVSRFSKVPDKGSIRVIVEIVDGDVTIGNSISGYIKLSGGTTDLVSLPRAYVHFSSIGAFVITATSERIPITIMYDYGDIVFVKGEIESGTTLMSTISGNL